MGILARMVTLKLAHPLTADQAARLRAKDITDYWTGDSITVPEEEANAIIQAGYAWGVDPENQFAVQDALSAPKASGKKK